MDDLELTTPLISHHVESPMPGELRLRLIGELDVSGTAMIDAEVAPLLDGDLDLLVLDLSELSFADSSAIAMWVGWARQVPRIELQRVSSLVRRVIETMGLEGTLHPS